MTADVKERETSLLDLLGRTWWLDSAIVDTCFDRRVATAAFLLDSGEIAIADTDDPDPVGRRARIRADDGRMTIAPRDGKKQPRPVSRLSLPDGRAICVRPGLGEGFLAASDGGQAYVITADQTVTPLGTPVRGRLPDLAVEPVNGRVAIAGEETVELRDAAGEALTTLTTEGEIGGIAFSRDGQRLAVADGGGIAIWRLGRSVSRQKRLAHEGELIRPFWSPDCQSVFAARADGGLHGWHLNDDRAIDMGGYPAPVRSVDWGPKGRFLATSGAYRIICWPISREQAGDALQPMQTGMAGVILVTAVAAQDKRDLVVAGYDNGIIVVCKAGLPDEMVLRGPGNGATSAMSWTRDGSLLAFGTQDGLAALVAFPDLMFK